MGFQFEGLGLSPLGGLRGWGPRPKLNFSEYGPAAYQIKADDAGSNMVANILPTDTPLTQGMGSKGQTIYFWKRCFLKTSVSNGIIYTKYTQNPHTIEPPFNIATQSAT